MKRIILLSAAVLASLSLFAQRKGDKYISASMSASLGSQTIETFDGAYTTTSSQPKGTTLSVMGEFGFFLADNFRLALALGVPFSSTPTSQISNVWLKSNTIGFQINPNIAYYVKLAQGLYYTPEIGFSYEFGSYKEDLTANTSFNAKYSGWDVYANLLALEFQVNPKFAVGVGIGNITYAKAKIKDKTSSAYYGTSQLQFNLNTASVHVRFYL